MDIHPGTSLQEVVDSTIRAAAFRSKNTAYGYLRAVGLFLSFLDHERGNALKADQQSWRPLASLVQEGSHKVWKFKGSSVVLELIDKSIIEQFLLSRERLGESKRSIKHRMTAVRIFLSVAYRDGLISETQAKAFSIHRYAPKPSSSKILPQRRILSLRQVRALRAAPDLHSTKGIRDRAILDLLLYALLTREQISQMAIHDFKSTAAEVYISVKKRGGGIRMIAAHKELITSIQRWMKIRRIGSLRDHQWMFTGVRHNKITASRVDAAFIGKLVSFYGAQSGIAPIGGSQSLKANDLRRTAARTAFDNGADLLEVQEMLGHSNPTTTAEYIGVMGIKCDSAIRRLKY
jgi:integrase/recombinase XerD